MYRIRIEIQRGDGTTVDRRYGYKEDAVHLQNWSEEISDMIDSLDNLDKV